MIQNPGRGRSRQAQRYRYPGHLRTSTPKRSHCHACGRQTLTATYNALPVRFDPQPLSMLGELTALLHKTKTWFIVNGNLFKRNKWSIEISPFGFGGQIVQEHNCNRAQPTGPAVAFPEPPPTNPGF